MSGNLPADGRRGRRAWTGKEIRQLNVLAKQRPRKTWAEVGQILGRSGLACKIRACRLDIPKGSPLQPWVPCSKTGIRMKRAVKGCQCEVCAWKRLERRPRDRMECPCCGKELVIVGKGPKRRVFAAGEEPGRPEA